jgi:hypothetical protein
LKQKVQREEGAINSHGSRHVRRCMIRQGGTHDRGRSASVLLWLVLIFFWVIFLILAMNIARSKGYSPLLWGLLACILPAGHRHHPAIAPVSLAGLACDLTPAGMLQSLA